MDIRSKPHIQNEWICLPVMAFLIETETGYILYDTGGNFEAMNGYWQKAMQEVCPFHQTEEEHLENQLSKCGVKPEEIKTVLLSHMYLVTEDFELEKGVEIINLPGHTEGLLGVVLHLAGGTVILPQDCVCITEIYGSPAKMSGCLFDLRAFLSFIEKVHTLQKKYDAKVIFAHDWNFFQTLKLVPEHYE